MTVSCARLMLTPGRHSPCACVRACFLRLRRQRNLTVAPARATESRGTRGCCCCYSVTAFCSTQNSHSHKWISSPSHPRDIYASESVYIRPLWASGALNGWRTGPGVGWKKLIHMHNYDCGISLTAYGYKAYALAQFSRNRITCMTLNTHLTCFEYASRRVSLWCCAVCVHHILCGVARISCAPRSVTLAPMRPPSPRHVVLCREIICIQQEARAHVQFWEFWIRCILYFVVYHDDDDDDDESEYNHRNGFYMLARARCAYVHKSKHGSHTHATRTLYSVRWYIMHMKCMRNTHPQSACECINDERRDVTCV